MIKWWKKGFFDVLKPFDTLSMDDVFSRYLGTLKTFPHYRRCYDNGEFFINIEKEDLEIPEIKYFHETYNSPNCSFEGPRKKLIYHLREHRNFVKPEYFVVHGRGGTVNYNQRDGQIRGGFATPRLFSFYYKPKLNKKITGEWVFLTLPCNLLREHLYQSNNGFNWEVAKEFVNEVDNTIGWNDTDKIKKLVDKYDEKHPQWNHDFPINGFIQMKKDGLLFPGAWVHYDRIAYHSYHRLIMTSLNGMDFPFIMPIPVTEDGVFTAKTPSINFMHRGVLSTLIAEIDLNNKKITFFFENENGRFKWNE